MDLLNYIEQARKAGMEDDKIREGLLQSGWQANDINEAIMKAPTPDVSQPKPRAMMSKASLAVILAIIGIATAGYFAGAYFMSQFQGFPLWPFETSVLVPTFTPRPSPTPMACTEEVKICPDGTELGRTGPNCEFAKCPEEIEQAQSRNLRRMADVQGIWNDVMNRMIDNKNLWTIDEVCKVNLPSTPTYIGTKYADVYSCLTNPKHFYEKVFDPLVGTVENSGYTIYISKDDKVTIAAPHSELGRNISAPDNIFQ